MLWPRKKPVELLAKTFPLAELRKRAKIVVIDDDENSFPTRALQDAGYTIEHWPNVKSLQRLEQGDFDIIILDIAGVASDLTPDDGLGVLEHLKTQNPAQIVVAFSGQSFDLSRQRFFKLADDTLQKPVDHLKCRQVIDQLIQSKFNVSHLWKTVEATLTRDGVSQKTVKRIEAKIARSIQQGSKPDFAEIVTDATGKAELAIKITGVLVKIGSLCGL